MRSPERIAIRGKSSDRCCEDVTESVRLVKGKTESGPEQFKRVAALGKRGKVEAVSL